MCMVLQLGMHCVSAGSTHMDATCVVAVPADNDQCTLHCFTLRKM